MEIDLRAGAAIGHRANSDDSFFQEAQGIWRLSDYKVIQGELVAIVKRPIANGAIFLSETSKAFAE